MTHHTNLTFYELAILTSRELTIVETPFETEITPFSFYKDTVYKDYRRRRLLELTFRELAIVKSPLETEINSYRRWTLLLDKLHGLRRRQLEGQLFRRS